MQQATGVAQSEALDDPLEGRPPVIVGGLPRSGTTLVAKLLGSHSEIAMPPGELGFFHVLWRPGDPADRPLEEGDDLDPRLPRLLTRVASWGFTEGEVREATRSLRTYRDLFVFLLDGYRRRVGKSRAGEKSVYNHQWLKVLDAWFDDYRFVHVVRNPVDSFASVKWLRRGTPRPNRVDLIPWLHEWNESVTLALHRSHSRPDRYSLVRYEDLVARPRDVLERLCKVVGVQPELERMVEMADVESPENSSFAEDRGQAEYIGRIRRADRADRAARIERHELDAIRSACAPLAHLVGYDVAPVRIRRGSLGQPSPGRVPPGLAARFLVGRGLAGLHRLVD